MSGPGARPSDPTPEPVATFRDGLLAIYRDLDEAVATLAPVCRLSGRCCRFEEYGHTLFVSEPEAALLLADAPPPSRPLDAGATCPWQDAVGRCTARDARPLGCRVYFCDPAFEPHASGISELYIGRLKRLVEDQGLPWGYAPLHHHLRRASEDGRFRDPAGPGVTPVDAGSVTPPGPDAAVFS